MKEEQEQQLDEVIESELITDSPRRIRVYDVGGDFFLDVPEGVRLTFGYFNPKGGGFNTEETRYGGRPSDVAKATALRIYGDSTDKRQLACFLGVKGFKDESIKLEKVVKGVIIETSVDDDGNGNVQGQFKQQRVVRAITEESEYAADDDLPF